MVALTGDYTEMILRKKDWTDEGKCATVGHACSLVEMILHILGDPKNGPVVIRYSKEMFDE